MLKYIIMLLTITCLLVSCKAEAYSDTFDVTFYSGGGITALGTPVYEGVIAVDPEVIPLGSVVYVEFFGEYSWLSGEYYAADTGSGIWGNMIDIYVTSDPYELGRTYAVVYY